MANEKPAGPVFTAQDLQNILNLISKAPIIGEEAETVVVLQIKLKQSIEMVGLEELPAETQAVQEFVAEQRAGQADSRVPVSVKVAKKAATKKTTKKR